MTTPWTPEDRERKKRVIRNISLWWIDTVRANHPETGKPCTRKDALEVLRQGHEHVVAKYAKLHGMAVAGRYRELIQEVMTELAAQVED